MRNLLILLMFGMVTWSVEAQFIPFSNPYSQFDYYIEKRAEELYQQRLKTRTEEIEHIEEEVLEEDQIISFGYEQEETEVIICFYDRNRNYDCAPVSDKDSHASN